MPARAAPSVAWAEILVIVFGGAAVALQVGKASVTLPALRDDFGLSVVLAAAYLSCISLCAALGGATFGWIATRIGIRLTGTIGLALMALASALGAFATGFGPLMAVRLAEAVALLMVVTAMPAILREATVPGRDAVPFGLWAAWMPVGIAAGMVIGRYGLEPFGWRGVHLICALPPAVGALLMAVCVLNRPARRMPPSIALTQGRRLYTPEVLRMAACFGLYSVIYMTFAAFVPTVATESLGFPVATASALAFWAAILIIPGNLAIPLLERRGARRRGMLVWSYLAMMLLGAGFFYSGSPVSLRVICALMFAPAAGVAAAVFWASVPRLADATGTPAARISGLFFQVSAAGQFLGPIASGAMVRATGEWGGGALVTVAAGLLAIMIVQYPKR